MGAWSDTEVFFPQPIAGVVPRPVARPCKVGYLVMFIVGCVQQIDESVMYVSVGVVVHRMKPPLLRPFPQHCFFFDGEGVRRYVLWIEAYSLFDIFRPPFKILLWNGVDQIDADVVEALILSTHH